MDDVSVPRQAEDLAYLDAVVGSSSDAIYRLDREGTILSWNRGAERLYGYSMSEAIGRRGAILFLDHQQDQADRILDQVLTGGAEEHLEVETRRKDGLLVPVLLTFSPIRNGAGEVRGASAIVRELTEQKLAQATMAESEARLQEAQALAHAGLWLWDVATGTVQWSDELHRIHGLDPMDFDGTYEAHLAPIVPEDRKKVAEAMEEAIRTGGALEEEYRIETPAGELRWVYIRGEGRTDSTGTLLGVGGICQDVTERKRAEQELRRHADLLQLLQRIAIAANEAESLDDALRSCLKDVCAYCAWPVAHARFVAAPIAGTAATGMWYLKYPARYLRFRRAIEASTLTSGFDLTSRVVQTGRPVWATDLAGHLGQPEAGVAAELGLQSGFAFPVLAGKDVVAVLEFFSDEVADPDERLMEAMAVAGIQLGRVLERQRSEDALSHQALHDPLTNLPNRTLFLDRLGHALARRERPPAHVAVMFLDLDGFKVVNDSLGHEAGDAVLAILAERLQAVVRIGDTVARFGGDEFTLLCEELTAPDDVLAIVERVAEAVSQPVMLDPGGEVVVTPSIGIAFAQGPGDTPEDVLRNADAAMYRAKEQGPARYEIFNVSMHERARHRLLTVAQLRHAVDRGQLRLFYQPQVSLPDGKIVGMEALVRWQHPERGLLGPFEFIPLAEESNLIVPIGNWVIEEACRQVARWHADYPEPRLRMCVNVSARQLSYAGLADVITQALSATGTDPGNLCIEITESALMGDGDFYLEALLGLKCLGVSLAVDDFGIGYSSLAYLKRFPIDVLKIDKAFVDGLGGGDARSGAIAGVVVQLAHALGLTPVAEGVETKEQVCDLKALDCTHAQGFYFARPQAPEAMTDLLADGGPLPVP